jgi:hypothetical protein
MEHYGKFRGKVVNNIDPLQQGRIIPLVPTISELPLSWALPCMPYAGKNVGFFALPPIGANVWIEFESGDPNDPIWTGAFWAKGETPAKPAVPTTIMLKNETMTVSLNQMTTELKLELKAPSGLHSITISAAGIKIASNAASINVAQQSIDVQNAPSTISVGPPGVSLKCAAGAVDVTPAATNVKNVMVNIN